jgi:hypothetical protein
MRQSGIYLVLMTFCASGRGMSAGEWESRMIESCSTPTNWLMATIALLRPALNHVIWTLRRLQVLLMTGFALDRSAQKGAGLRARVTTKASNRSMRTNQWKSRLIVHGNLAIRQPIVLVVALRAIMP